jgi:hypothetical protein
MPENESANAQNTSTNVDGEATDQTDQEHAPAANARLLRESREWKSKYQTLKHEQSEAEKKRLESQQEWKALAEKLTEEKRKLEDSYRREKIRSAVHDKALRAGCVNVEDLLKVGNSELLQLDDETQTVQGADLFVEEARRLKPYLFQSSKNTGKSSTINSVTPGSVPEKKISSAEIASMRPGDPRKLAAWSDALKASKQ